MMAMNLNISHPNFDMAFELLCLLPIEPCFALVEHISMDLGIDGRQDITALVDRLRKKGIDIKSHYAACEDAAQGLHGRALCIRRNRRVGTQTKCEKYLASLEEPAAQAA